MKATRISTAQLQKGWQKLSATLKTIATGRIPTVADNDDQDGAVSTEKHGPTPALDSRRRSRRRTNSDRSTERISINTELGIESEHHFFTGFSEDIVEGGIFVATFDPKPVGSKVLVKFKLPGNHQVVARGEVQFVQIENELAGQEHRQGMGIGFTNLLPSDKEAIEQYLKLHNPLFYDK